MSNLMKGNQTFTLNMLVMKYKVLKLACVALILQKVL